MASASPAAASPSDSAAPQAPLFDGTLYTGPAYLVSNTFIDFDDRAPDAAGSLKRAQTEPRNKKEAEHQGSIREELQGRPAAGAPADDAEQPFDDWGDCGDEEPDQGGDDGGDDPDRPGTPGRLCRNVTQNWYEPAEAWEWDGQTQEPLDQLPQFPAQMQQMHPQAQQMQSQGGYQSQQQPPVMQPMQQQQVILPAGVGAQPVMYPMPSGQMVPMVPMLVPMPADGSMPQLPMMGMNLMQPDRGMRWPMDQQQQQQQQYAAAQMEMPNSINIVQSQGDTPNTGDTLPTLPSALGKDDEAPAPPQPHTLTRLQSVSVPLKSRVYWTVDARKLRGNDKQAVSPPFELSFGPQYPSVIFKMMIYPKVVNDGKGGASFKKARGHGFVQLKCEAELAQDVAQVQYRIGIGSCQKMQNTRGPVPHNFAHSAVSRLPKDVEEWDFNSVVDQESMTFMVFLEITPSFRG